MTVVGKKKKLTLEEMKGYDMYKDIEQALAERRGLSYSYTYVRGLPFELQFSNGTTVDRDIKL
jgi:salicylate hydroxylase